MLTSVPMCVIARKLTLTGKPASTPELGFHLMRAFRLDAGFAGISGDTFESWLTAARPKWARYIWRRSTLQAVPNRATCMRRKIAS